MRNKQVVLGLATTGIVVSVVTYLIKTDKPAVPDPSPTPTAKANILGEGGFAGDDVDPDGDGLNDVSEILISTSKNDPDTDKDGYNDGDEVKKGFDPKGPGTLSPEDRQSLEDVGTLTHN